jgi:transglutaminase-like putative cysteine protease/uncharacterized membrane protein YgcG
MSEPHSTRLTAPAEPLSLWLLKASAHLGAVTLYLIFVTSPFGLSAALLATLVALVGARRFGGQLSSSGARLIVGVSALSGWVVSALLERVALFSTLFGPSLALKLSDGLFLSLGAFALVLGMRVWGTRSRWGSGLEAGFVLLSVVQLFAAHRGGQLHEPRFFTDWVLIGGYRDINWWLDMFGLGVASLALVMWARVRRAYHLVFASLSLALLMALIYSNINTEREGQVVEPISFGQSKGDSGQGGGGQGDQGGGGKGEGEGEGSDGGGGSPPDRPPTPVAVAVFHDDYTPNPGVFYFRQEALSYFDGVKLVADPTGRFDRDVIKSFPNEEPLKAAPVQSEGAHLEVSTSMFLIDAHPTPPALTHGVEVRPLDNPDPQRFATAYGVLSRVPSVPLTRHVGKRSVPVAWSDEERAHYLATHSDDPRYVTLAREVTRELPSHLAADPLRRAIAIKRYLEQEGYYTLKVKHRSNKDPVAPFLFGDMRGYCVHFAHSAVHLLRSQGIAARVALGYAVDARTRSNSSAVVITGDRAHAWPEIHVEGVGWVTFDIYPERSDEPPPTTVSQSLESLLGELARDQVRRGLDERPLLPWRELAVGFGLTLIAVVLLAYLMSALRLARLLWSPQEQLGRLAYLATLDRLSGSGLGRERGETREAHAARLAHLAPSLPALTNAHLSWALGEPSHRAERGDEVAVLARRARAEFASNHRGRWLLSWLNPFSWLMSR